MKDYVFTFRTAVRKAKKEEIEDESEFVNNFMWEHQLYGEDVYNKLLIELQKTVEFENALKEVAKNHGFSISPKSSFAGYNKGEISACGTAFV